MPSPIPEPGARWSPIPTSESALLEELLRLDRERGWLALLAPPAGRLHLAAFFGLDAELAAVGSRVAEPMAGLVRFQWWREALEGLGASGPRPHPLMAVLDPLVATGGVPLEALLDLVDAHEEAFERASAPGAEAAVELADRTGARVHAYAMSCLGGSHEWVERAHRAGRALTLVRMATGRPAARGTPPPAIVRRLAAAARADLEAVPRLRPPRRLLAPMLALRLVRLHLRRLERAEYDPRRLAALPPAMPLPGLLLARVTGRT